MIKLMKREIRGAVASLQRLTSRPERMNQFPKTEATNARMQSDDGVNDQLNRNDLSSMTTVDQVRFFVDYKKSKGNYFQDSDKNTILDLTSNNGVLPLGYNHSNFVSKVDSEMYDRYLYQRLFQTLTPSTCLNSLIKRVLVPYAPFKLDKIHLFDDISGTSANDFAMWAAFIKHHANVTGKDIDMKSFSSKVTAPEVDYEVVSFSGAYHGGSLATLSASSHHQKFMLPNFMWNILSYPNSFDEEAAAVEDFSNYLKERPQKVAALIIQPI
jgi:4-aminobutyrate aminotransferase-like enzyme